MTMHPIYTGLLTLRQCNVILDEDLDINEVEFDFNEKAQQQFNRKFIFSANVTRALRELKLFNEIKYGKSSFLFPHFVPVKGLCKENYLFLFNVNRFLGFNFSFRTFRVHAISVVAENKLQNWSLGSNLTASQFSHEMRRVMESVRVNFSNHSGRSSILPYLDIRIFILAGFKFELECKDIEQLLNTFFTAEQEYSWTGKWLKMLRTYYDENEISIDDLFIFS